MSFLKAPLFTLIYSLFLHLGFCKAYQTSLVALIKTVARGRGITKLIFTQLCWRLTQSALLPVYRRLFLISLNSVPCLTVLTKGLREFKQGLMSYSGGNYKGKLNYQ